MELVVYTVIWLAYGVLVVSKVVASDHGHHVEATEPISEVDVE